MYTTNFIIRHNIFALFSVIQFFLDLLDYFLGPPRLMGHHPLDQHGLFRIAPFLYPVCWIGVFARSSDVS